MDYLFINGSPNKNGNTAALAKALLKDQTYETVHLTDYRIYSYGQQYEDDQFNEVIAKMKEADVIVLGSPLYWHNLCGSVRNLFDRFYDAAAPGDFLGKQLLFIIQGASPEQWMLDAGEYTVKRFCMLYGFDYLGMITNSADVQSYLNEK